MQKVQLNRDFEMTSIGPNTHAARRRYKIERLMFWCVSNGFLITAAASFMGSNNRLRCLQYGRP